MIIRLSLTIKVLARKFESWISRFSMCLCFRFCFGFLHSNFHCRFAVFQMCRSCAAVFVSVSLHARRGTELSRSRSTVSFRGVMLATVIRRGLQSNFSEPRNLPTRSFHSEFSRIVILLISFKALCCEPGTEGVTPMAVGLLRCGVSL